MPALPPPIAHRLKSPGEPALIDVLVFDQFSLMSLAATIEPLRAANRVSGQELYRWRLLSPDGESPSSSSGMPIGVAGEFSRISACARLFVVAAFGARSIGRGIAADLRAFGRQGVPLVGIEAGAWVLGRVGLLDGYRATTHWEDLEEFAGAFPKITVVSDRFVMDRARWTTGGAAPTLDLMLAMIHADHGLPIALDVAGVFIYEQAPASSAPQAIVSLGRLAATDPQLSAVINLMQANLEEPLPIPDLGAAAGLLPRALQARFQRQLGIAPHAYYLDLRLAAARRMLQHSDHSVVAVANAYGFGSASAFARAFRSRFGLSPRDCKRQGGDSWAARR